ncbi:MAG: hypothetical protein JNJ57_11120 [Saprospiraceae bacterium]|nr:hypothetical protein [Saprospiraceae bacterium]
MKPIFMLAVLASTALLLYSANDAKAQSEPFGLFKLPALSPSVITISPRFVQPQELPPSDTAQQMDHHDKLEKNR